MMNDARYAARLLVRTPGFTLAAVLTLALGIGATTAIYTLVEAIILRPLPIDEPDRVVVLQAQEGDRLARAFTYPAFRRYREHAGQVFESIAGSGERGFRVSVGTDTRLAQVEFVTEDYFTTAGVRAAHGRVFFVDEHQQGAEPAVVLTDAFWKSRMAGDPAVVGQQIRIADRHATIVGIAPRGFRGLQLDSPQDMFIPLSTAALVLPAANYFDETVIRVGGRGYSPQAWIEITGRLRTGVSIEQAETVLSTIVAQPTRKGPQPVVRLVGASEAALSARTQGDTIRFTALLAMVVALVLLVGCANLSGLILARNEQRRREVAVRLALGARRWRVIRLFMVESLLLSLLGGLMGMAVALWMLQVMQAFVIPGGINLESLQLVLTGRVVLFAVAAALFTALLTGLMPAVAGSRGGLVSGLRTHGGVPAGRVLVRSSLVAMQIAISLVLLVTGGLFVRSLRTALVTDVGTDVKRLAYANIPFWSAGYDRSRISHFYDTLLVRLRDVPEIEIATYGDLPLASSPDSTPAFGIDGVEQQLPQTALLYCGPDYFTTTGIQLTAGRELGAQDTAESPPVVIVNEAFARRAWPGQNPIGRQLSILPSHRSLEVVGVARDGKYYNLREQGRLAVYMPWQQHPARGTSWGTVIVRGRGSATAALATLLSEVRGFDSTLPISRPSTLADRIGTLAMTERLGASFLSWFSALALALAVLGVYGLIAHAVARRTNEIGVRLALGAAPRDVVFLTMRGSLLPVAAGVILGIAGAYALTRLATAFLFGVAPHDPLSFAGATLCLIVAAEVASYLPARRADRVDPMIALRAE